MSLVERGTLDARHDGAFAARRRPAPDRRRRDGRAPAGAPLRDRRLPRRGHAHRHRRLRDAGAGARARHDRAVPARCWTGTRPCSAAGERFAYNNGGYVVLALLAERASGVDFHELVRTLVCEPAGMVDTAFLRSDELPGRAALGYLGKDGLRTNVFHLPVLRHRRRWHLLDGRRPQRLLGRPLRRTDRLAGAGRRDGATAQRLAGGVQALRPRVPPPRHGRRGLARGARRRRVVHERCTSPRHRPPTPSSRTGRTAPGRSSRCSRNGSGPDTSKRRR